MSINEFVAAVVAFGLFGLLGYGMCQDGKARERCYKRKCAGGVPRRNEGTNYECQCVTYPR